MNNEKQFRFYDDRTVTEEGEHIDREGHYQLVAMPIEVHDFIVDNAFASNDFFDEKEAEPEDDRTQSEKVIEALINRHDNKLATTFLQQDWLPHLITLESRHGVLSHLWREGVKDATDLMCFLDPAIREKESKVALLFLPQKIKKIKHALRSVMTDQIEHTLSNLLYTPTAVKKDDELRFDLDFLAI